jgi:short-subunit dehydrogenase
MDRKHQMTDFQQRVVLITGASAGIGAALARVFAQQGAKVALLARRQERLETLAHEINRTGGQALAIICDVKKDADLHHAVERIHQSFGLIDIVIANAGFGVVGHFEKLQLDDFQRQFDTNVYGVLRTIYATLADLKATRGRLVVLGSLMSHFSMPTTAPYTMSKYALRALTEALRTEFAEMGIAVTLISPGFVKTEIRNIDNQGRYHPDAKDPIPTWLRMTCDTTAQKIAMAILKRKREALIGGTAKVTVLMSRLFPRLMSFLLRKIYQRLLAKRINP